MYSSIVLVLISFAVSSCSKKLNYNNLTLYNCEELNGASANSIVDQLISDRTLSVALAVSSGGQAAEGAYDSFEEYYLQRKNEFTQILGPPSWEGTWSDPGYPDWALGEQIAIWDHQTGKIYLRINWEDDMIPVIVSIGTTDSNGSFNNQGESPYKFLSP